MLRLKHPRRSHSQHTNGAKSLSEEPTRRRRRLSHPGPGLAASPTRTGHPAQKTTHLTIFDTADGVAEDCSWIRCHSCAQKSWDISPLLRSGRPFADPSIGLGSTLASPHRIVERNLPDDTPAGIRVGLETDVFLLLQTTVPLDHADNATTGDSGRSNSARSVANRSPSTTSALNRVNSVWACNNNYLAATSLFLARSKKLSHCATLSCVDRGSACWRAFCKASEVRRCVVVVPGCGARIPVFGA